MAVVIQELIRRTTGLHTPEQAAEFHRLREEAFAEALRTHIERAASYNVGHEAYEEMPFGAVSLAGEIFKRAIRMTGLMSPLREGSLNPDDLKRLLGSCIDVINYASWQYALLHMALSAEDVAGEDDPDDPEPPKGATFEFAGPSSSRGFTVQDLRNQQAADEASPQ